MCSEQQQAAKVARRQGLSAAVGGMLMISCAHASLELPNAQLDRDKGGGLIKHSWRALCPARQVDFSPKPHIEMSQSNVGLRINQTAPMGAPFDVLPVEFN